MRFFSPDTWNITILYYVLYTLSYPSKQLSAHLRSMWNVIDFGPPQGSELYSIQHLQVYKFPLIFVLNFLRRIHLRLALVAKFFNGETSFSNFDKETIEWFFIKLPSTCSFSQKKKKIEIIPSQLVIHTVLLNARSWR